MDLLKPCCILFYAMSISESVQPPVTVVDDPQKRRALPFIAYEDQQQITRLCVRCGLLLMQHGAESSVVVDLCQRLGHALGLSSVECGLVYNSITITTIYNNRCITTLRASTSQNINLHVVVQIQRIVLDLEAMPKASTLEHAIERFDAIDRTTYPTWVVAPMVGVACACFAYLAGGDLAVVAVTWVAGTCGLAVRKWLTQNHFNPFVAAMMTAFVASMLGSLALAMQIGNDPHIAIASSVLLLLPSFPLINSFSDMLKGYMAMGMGRLAFVLVMTLSTCIGIMCALLLLRIDQWGMPT